MKAMTHKRYSKNRGVAYLVEKFETLSLEARMRQEVFFNTNLNRFKKFMGGR